MKAKLIKTDKGNYVLTDTTKGTYEKGYMLGSSRECDLPKLSLKNCQAIERGYDLEELAYEFSWNYQSDPNYGDTIHVFKEGFQKCLELMGDKKFSEEDIRMAFSHVQNEPTFDEFIQSLQQTEWDVEIEKENVMHDYNGNISLGAKFKLDADGCLILKRID